MNKKILLTNVLISALVLTACNSTPKPKKFNIDRAKNITRIQYTLESHKSDNGHKAMAVALDAEGKYVIGYSFDCASEESAKSIALNNCRKANANAEVKPNAACTIFAVENSIVKPLK